MTEVDIAPIARVEIDELDFWWSTHRLDCPRQVEEELERIIDLLEVQPEIGAHYPHSWREGLRWLRLKKTPYQVVYHYERGRDLVMILSVWSGEANKGPSI